MSAISEFREKLDVIQATSARTANDVGWIKERLEKDDKRIAKLEANQWKLSTAAATLGAVFGGGGAHFLRVLALAAALTTMVPAQAGSDDLANRRAAILKAVYSIGVYPGAELAILGNVYRVESVEVDARYTVTIKTKLIR